MSCKIIKTGVNTFWHAVYWGGRKCMAYGGMECKYKDNYNISLKQEVLNIGMYDINRTLICVLLSFIYFTLTYFLLLKFVIIIESKRTQNVIRSN